MAEEDRDVLGKADALLRRGIKPPADGSETGGVPVLTDLVETPAEEPVEAPEPDAFEPPPPLSGMAEVGPDLTREVIDRVLAEVEHRLAADLERRVLEHLTPQVHAAVASALGDLHQELANAIGDAVTEALRARQAR
jgi:hypothetical protein